MTPAGTDGTGSRSGESRAQTEALGFVLVFSLIVVTVGVVSVTGFAALDDARQSQQVENVGRAFEILDRNVGDIYHRGAPSRGTEIKLAGGSVGDGPSTRVELNATQRYSNGTWAPDHNLTTSATMAPILYRSGHGDRIVYVSGARFRGDGEGASMVQSPDWLVEDEQTVVPLVATYWSGGGSISGKTTLLVVADRESRGLGGRIVADSDARLVVNVTVESPRAAAWKRYFRDRSEFGSVSYDASTDTVTATFETDALYVPRTKIAYRIER